MARLEVEIGGNTSGLGQAANRALGILGSLQKTADNLKIELFSAKDVATMNATGGALVSVTSKIKEYTDAAIKGSVAFKENQTAAVLDNLSTKLTILNGNAALFGSTIKNQEQQVKANEAAISKLLQNGLSPYDQIILKLKDDIESLNRTIAAGKASQLPPMFSQFEATGKLIPDLEAKIKRLKLAVSESTDSRSLALYNVRLREAQNELDKLKNKGLVSENVNKRITESLNAQAAASKRVAGSYNSVSLEFGRIIQDAPYAASNFGAIGNNITRLVEVLPGYTSQLRETIKAQGGAATSGAVFKAGLAGIFTGFSGLSLVISAAVTAYTIYGQSQAKAKKETDELNKSTLSYTETLKGVVRSQLEGTKNAQQDLVNLRLLYKAYQDANAPLEARYRAYKQLQQQWPETFGNLKFEEKASKATSAAYTELAGSILASARARAAANLITKNAETQLENETKLIKLKGQQEKLELNILKERNAELIKNQANTEGTGSVTALQDIGRAQGLLNANLAAQNKLKQENAEITKENMRLDAEAQKQQNKGGNLTDFSKPGKNRTKATPANNAPNIVQRSDNSDDLLGLEGLDREVEQVRQKYIKLYQDLEANAKKSAEARKTYETDLFTLQKNEGSEVTKLVILEQTRVAEEIQRIRNESGVKSAEDRAKELAQIQKWYDDQINKAQGNADIIVAIEEGKQAQINAVNEKYIQKRIEAEQKLIDSIEKLQEKGFKENTTNTKKGTKAIDDELAKRLKAVKEYFDKLRELYKGDVIGQIAIDQSEKSVNAGITSQADGAKSAGGIDKELTRAVRRFGEDFYRTLTTLNQQADQTFASIFSTLTSGLTSALDDIFLNVFQKKLAEVFDKSTAKLGTGLTNALAGAGLLGGVISGVTKKTSAVGQGLGGAISGAAAGTAILPGIGTLIGGILGGLGGIFGASKAKKAEELQKKQLAETEKQTKLLERQNALAYTSSIIGRMTTQGVVKGVEVNEFGQLSTKIVGQDIQVVLDRANRSRKRGN